MYIVKDDNPDVGFVLNLGTVTDSEGHEVPSDSLVITVESDNPDAVAVTMGNDDRSGSISFGAPGLANLNVQVESASGKLVGSFGAQFTVTVGDPAAISGGSISFDGLTEASEEPAPTESPVPPTEEPAPTEEPVEQPAPPVEEEPAPVEEPAPSETPIEEPPTEEPSPTDLPANPADNTEVPVEEPANPADNTTGGDGSSTEDSRF